MGSLKLDEKAVIHTPTPAAAITTPSSNVSTQAQGRPRQLATGGSPL